MVTMAVSAGCYKFCSRYTVYTKKIAPTRRKQDEFQLRDQSFISLCRILLISGLTIISLQYYTSFSLVTSLINPIVVNPLMTWIIWWANGKTNGAKVHMYIDRAVSYAAVLLARIFTSVQKPFSQANKIQLHMFCSYMYIPSCKRNGNFARHEAIGGCKHRVTGGSSVRSTYYSL